MKNFWRELPRPFFTTAPLANVTDAAFRRMIAKYSKQNSKRDSKLSAPHVMYTEFVSADGLFLADEIGKSKLLRDLLFSESERPIVAQFFTSKPEMMERAAGLARELGFDGVDINMGCPDRTIEKQNAGAALMKNPKLAQELIAAAKRGANRRDASGKYIQLPVSVKIRLGYNKDILEEWLPALLEMKPAAIALHARTRKEMSKVPAKWERVMRAVEIRDELKSDSLIIGNGDAKDLEDAREKVAQSGADGVMLGRALFGKPWLFQSAAEIVSKKSSDLPHSSSDEFRARLFSQQFLPSLADRLRIAAEHAKLFEELLGDIKNFAIMKKHFKAYVEGFDGAKELRARLMETENAAEVAEVIEEFLRI